MEGWVKKWLEEQRRKGEKGLEVKKLWGSYYVYRSTTYWDKDQKKRRKRSSYLGTLDREKGLVKSSGRVMTKFRVREVLQYGNAMLLHQALKPVLPVLKEGFRAWREVYALALVRTLGHVPLKRVSMVWERLYDPLELDPSLSPRYLAGVLRSVGLDRSAQRLVFQGLARPGRYLIYDLSVVFSQAPGVTFAELGWNPKGLYLPQINLALLYSAEQELPVFIRAIPGSVRDIATLHGSLLDLGLEDKVLVLDRGFYSAETLKYLKGEELDFVLPAKRNSPLYLRAVSLDEHFFYQRRLIKAGKAWHERGGFYLYLFEDSQLRMEEERTLYLMLDDGRLKKEKLEGRLKKAGRILILSSLDVEPRELFEIYKSRGGIEKLFDKYKNILHGDRLYLRDNESVFGHIFVSFLSLYAYCRLMVALKKAGLIGSLSPMDLLELYSKVYYIKGKERSYLTEIPRKVADVERKLNLNVFPKVQS